MRIPGFALRSRVGIIPAGVDYGDGPVDQEEVRVKAQLATKTAMVIDMNGRTLTQWSVVRIRPDTRIGSPARLPAAGDRIRVEGVVREIKAVEPIVGPGTAVSYLEITAADSTGSQTVTGNG